MEAATRIEELVRPLVEGEGYELKGVEYGGEELTVTIDKEGGVSVEDCARISRLIDPLIERADLIQKHYYLVVSSPGIP